MINKICAGLLLLCCTTASASFSLPLTDPEQTLVLQFEQYIEAGQTDALAVLMPLPQQVKVASRLILVAKKKLALADLPSDYKEVITSLELLHQYRGHFIYLLSLADLTNTLRLYTVLQQHPSLLYLQPDLLPLRPKPSKAPSLHNTLYINENTFSVVDYLALGKLWQHTKGHGVKIAVIDTGVSLNLPALQQINQSYSWDIDLDIAGAVPEPQQKHGNKVAGLIWAMPHMLSIGGEMLQIDAKLLHNAAKFSTDHAVGIAPDAELIALKLQRPWTSNLLRALIKSELQQADVINISWLLPWVATPVRDYLRYLVSESNHGKGIMVVVAADPQFRPNQGLAAMPELLVVSSTDHRGTLADSSWDTTVDIAAASYVLTTSQLPGRKYEMFAKTSSSAALVSGWLALLRSLRPDLTVTELQLLLTATGTAVKQPLPQGQSFNYKVLNASQVVYELTKK
ncbi:S8/S53 family peptidase [Shewanella morhuae]|uniref:S8/S53 family peptidase n=1 Tax=Shewanella morhuae TaxID=365591 RepID=UPI0015F18CB8|nr:S8/S53 family peptidase [Shewanella morhuae]